jgi:hypothetical protein
VSHPIKINTAIRECLDSLPTASSPIAHLAAFIAQLRADPCWTDYEVNEVEIATRRILANMVIRS